MKTAALANSTVASPLTQKDRTSRRTVERVAKIPYPLALLALSIILPEELSFYIFGLRLTPTRLLLIVITPLLVGRLSRLVSARRYHLVLPDVFVALSGFWMIFAAANLSGFADALNHAGPIALEFCVSYMATRVLLSESGQALKFVSLLCWLLAAVGLLAALDSLAGHFVIHDLASTLTGYHKSWQVDYRFGLLRATGPFEHPIFLGMLSAIGLVIASYVDIGSRLFVIAGCACGAIFAFSSGPFECILISVALLMYNRFLPSWSFKWNFLIGIFAAVLIAIHLTGRSPLAFLFQNLIYDPSSGYYRYWTWTMVSAAVEQSPWIGLGFGPFPDYMQINHTIDALWLVLALNFGLPGAFFVALAMITATRLPVCSSQMSLSSAEEKLGLLLGITIFVLILISCTADFWGSAWIITAVLMGVKVHLSELGRVRKQTPRILSRSEHVFDSRLPVIRMSSSGTTVNCRRRPTASQRG
jgi:hypothetical protein